MDDKRIAGEEAVRFVEDGMVVGLGSGTTVYWMLKKLGEQIRKGLNIQGIPSSINTERLAKQFGIPLTDFSNVNKIDLAIDGSSEVDENFNLLKGGGGSLVREKIIDGLAEELIIIIDESKKVSRLGNSPLPVEVIPFAWQQTAKKISNIGSVPKIRKIDNNLFISDNGNFILDCKFNEINHPEILHKEIKLLNGVVDTGLFSNMADKVITAGNGKIEVLINNQAKYKRR